jgi:hypothetical protein
MSARPSERLIGPTRHVSLRAFAVDSRRHREPRIDSPRVGALVTGRSHPDPRGRPEPPPPGVPRFLAFETATMVRTRCRSARVALRTHRPDAPATPRSFTTRGVIRAGAASSGPPLAGPYARRTPARARRTRWAPPRARVPPPRLVFGTEHEERQVAPCPASAGVLVTTYPNSDPRAPRGARHRSMRKRPGASVATGRS